MNQSIIRINGRQLIINQPLIFHPRLTSSFSSYPSPRVGQQIINNETADLNIKSEWKVDMCDVLGTVCGMYVDDAGCHKYLNASVAVHKLLVVDSDNVIDKR